MGRPFKIERSIEIAAPPEHVFAIASDLGRWNDWSPYVKADPGVKFTVTEPRAGVGGRYAWTGSKSGEGQMTITAVDAPRRATLQLEFVKPFKAVNETVFACEPLASGSTRFSWTMSGDRPWPMVVLAALLGLDRMLAGQFDEGLAMLKALAERRG